MIPERAAVRIRGRSALRGLASVLLERPVDDRATALLELEREFPEPPAEVLWLTLAVLGARLPTSEEVIAARRRAQLEGFGAILRTPVRESRRDRVVLIGETLVDAHHTVRSGLLTGIQRVARNILDRWQRRPHTLIGWNSHFDALTAATASGVSSPVIVPWRSRYLLLELVTEAPRLDRLQALAEFGGGETGVIGLDAVPLTMAETTGPGMPGAFARNLAAISRFDRVAAISDAAASEYRGWLRMIAPAGLVGPDVRSVPLGQEGIRVSDPIAPAIAEEAALVLCVGSHEPRKNHEAILFALETLWSEGRHLHAVFVGGNSWKSARFEREVERLQALGRPLEMRFRASDAELAGLYAHATATLFPSLHEGFGLPIVESLAVGTPVLTSDYGSMAELGAAGAVLIDPRDDRALVDGLRRLVVDAELRVTLRRAAAARVVRSWDDYADELWSFLLGVPVAPDPSSAAGAS